MKANRPEWMYITIGMFGACVRGAVMPAFAFFYSEIFAVYSCFLNIKVSGFRIYLLFFF